CSMTFISSAAAGPAAARLMMAAIGATHIRRKDSSVVDFGMTPSHETDLRHRETRRYIAASIQYATFAGRAKRGHNAGLLFQRRVKNAVDLDDIVVEQALHLDHGAGG